MNNSFRPGGGRFNIWKNRSPIFWFLLAVSAVGLAFFLIFPRGERNFRPTQIPQEALSKIQQERGKAQKDHEDFMKTPAGKIWEKYPYWDRLICQLIAEGRVSQGMSKEQVREALGPPAKIKPKKGQKILYEEWEIAGKEKMVLKFEDNTLIALERKP